MSVTYLKSYKINNLIYGIEDQEQAGEHFFPHQYKEGSRQRFSIWRGGCGCGQAKTLEEAEKKLQAYIKNEIAQNIEKHQTALEFWRDTNTVFSTYGIGKFGI